MKYTTTSFNPDYGVNQETINTYYGSGLTLPLKLILEGDATNFSEIFTNSISGLTNYDKYNVLVYEHPILGETPSSNYNKYEYFIEDVFSSSGLSAYFYGYPDPYSSDHGRFYSNNDMSLGFSWNNDNNDISTWTKSIANLQSYLNNKIAEKDNLINQRRIQRDYVLNQYSLLRTNPTQFSEKYWIDLSWEDPEIPVGQAIGTYEIEIHKINNWRLNITQEIDYDTFITQYSSLKNRIRTAINYKIEEEYASSSVIEGSSNTKIYYYDNELFQPLTKATITGSYGSISFFISEVNTDEKYIVPVGTLSVTPVSGNTLIASRSVYENPENMRTYSFEIKDKELYVVFGRTISVNNICSAWSLGLVLSTSNLILPDGQTISQRQQQKTMQYRVIKRLEADAIAEQTSEQLYGLETQLNSLPTSNQFENLLATITDLQTQMSDLETQVQGV